MRVRGVINSRSGSCIDQEVEAIRATVGAAFEAQGHDCRMECAGPDSLLAAIDRAVSERPDVLAVGGGDGTIRAAAVALVGKPIALAPIPLGTMNRFARDLRIPLDPLAAARSLATGERGLADVAEVNGQIFLCNSMIGLPPEFSVQRGALRGKGLVERMAGYLRLIRDFVSSTHRITVTLDDGRGPRRVRALSVIVSNNLYGEEISPMVLRSSLSGGVLGIYISRHRSGAGIAMAFLRAMLGRWKSDRSLEFTKAHQLTLATHGHRARVSNDGEVAVMASPLVYRIRPKALLVLRPIDGNADILAAADGEPASPHRRPEEAPGAWPAAVLRSIRGPRSRGVAPAWGRRQ